VKSVSSRSNAADVAPPADHAPPAGTAPDPSLEADHRWQLVQRIIKSRPFVKSARLQDFLLYVCRCNLAGHNDEINEQRIGERVFQRSANYNPTEDNIVRSQARLLRQRLQDYFASEGESEPLLIVIPKGGYSPEFVQRPKKSSVETRAAAAPNSAASRIGLVRSLFVAIAALAAVSVFQAWLLFKSKAPQPAAEAQAPLPPAVNALWSQLFSQGLPTTVIVPDSTVGMLQEATNQPVDLATYLRRSPATDNQKVKEIEGTLRGFSIRRYTTFDSVSTAVRVAELAHQFHCRSAVRYARDMTLGEFSPGNVVLIGRPLTNPWSAMFEPKLNFQFHSDLGRDMAICVNRSPQPGELAEYLPIEEGAKRTVYAAVAFIPNLNDAGCVLIIAGTSSGAQGMAAEFLTTENLLSPFINKLPRSEKGIPFFEVLIRTVTLAGVAQEPEVIAYRVRERQS
jgi:hypothetical protein